MKKITFLLLFISSTSSLLAQLDLTKQDIVDCFYAIADHPQIKPVAQADFWAGKGILIMRSDQFASSKRAYQFESQRILTELQNEDLEETATPIQFILEDNLAFSEFRVPHTTTMQIIERAKEPLIFSFMGMDEIRQVRMNYQFHLARNGEEWFVDHVSSQERAIRD